MSTARDTMPSNPDPDICPNCQHSISGLDCLCTPSQMIPAYSERIAIRAKSIKRKLSPPKGVERIAVPSDSED